MNKLLEPDYRASVDSTSLTLLGDSRENSEETLFFL